MRLEINIEKKHFWTTAIIAIVLSGIIFVYAYSSAIPNPGHGGDTILVETPTGEMTLQDAIDSGELVDTDTDTQCDSSGSCNQICIDNDCVSSWSETLTKGNPSCAWEAGRTCSGNEYWIGGTKVRDIGNHNQQLYEVYCCRNE